MNIIITGASKGFGKAIAKKYAAHHHNLYICARNAVVLNQTVDELASAHPNITIKAMPCDLGKKDEAIQFGKWIIDQHITIDVLINNAGLFTPGSIADEPGGTLEQMIAVNLYSAYHLTRTILPVMMKQKHGHIFNMCSIASLQAYANGGAYSISKYALLGMTRNLREEMKAYNIKVTAVLPGAAYTDSWKGSGVNPGRIMEAGDIAEMIYTSSMLSPMAVVEDIILRPQLGDL